MTTEIEQPKECKKEPFTTFDHYTFVSSKGVGRVTVAMYVNNNSVKVGVALCSPKDQFSKKRGREMALRRLNSNSKMNFEIMLVNGHPGLKKKVYLTFLQICSRGWFSEKRRIPGWLRKPAYDAFHVYDSHKENGNVHVDDVV